MSRKKRSSVRDKASTKFMGNFFNNLKKEFIKKKS